jgi:hypothetical protein
MVRQNFLAGSMCRSSWLTYGRQEERRRRKKEKGVRGGRRRREESKKWPGTEYTLQRHDTSNLLLLTRPHLLIAQSHSDLINGLIH